MRVYSSKNQESITFGKKIRFDGDGATRPVLHLPWSHANEAMGGSGGEWGGLPYPGMVVIAGRPGMGKSSLAEQISLNFEHMSNETEIRAIPHVMFCGLERGWRAHASSIASRTRTDPSELIISMIDADSAGDIVRIAEQAHPNSPIEDGGRSLESVRSVVPVIVVDFIQCVQGPGDSEKERIDHALRLLHSWAKENDGIVILVSQMNRSIETGRNRRVAPKMSDLEHTGLLEQLADVIIFPIRESVLFGRPSTDREKCSIHIVKNRDGRTCSVPMIWNGPERKFEAP